MAYDGGEGVERVKNIKIKTSYKRRSHSDVSG